MNDLIKYMPEGLYPYEKYSLASLEQARIQKRIIEARAVLCDDEHNLTVDLGCMKGIIPREKTTVGIRDGSVRDIAILTRTGKICCFYVEGYDYINGERIAVLNREKAMYEALNYMLENYCTGDVIDAKITHLDRFGAFADIGCGNVGLINIENCSVSRISHPSDRFYKGQHIKVVIKNIDTASRRFTLSHKELLGTWIQNASMFSIGQTVGGMVRSVTDYGIFIELTPNLSGLADLVPEKMNYLNIGGFASVYIKSIIPEKMKIKLNIIDLDITPPEDRYSFRYFLPPSGRVERFEYSPPNCERAVLSEF